MKFDLAGLLATAGGLGHLPLAPGTTGAAGGLLLAFALWSQAGWWTLAGATGLVMAIGVWASGREAARSAEPDPGHIVIDEVAGQMIACALFLAFVPSAALLPWLLAFLLFRLFDIFKPWPVGALEKLPPPAAGIMADDIAAGLMAGGLVAAFFAM